jgi:dynein heavy chain
MKKCSPNILVAHYREQFGESQNENTVLHTIEACLRKLPIEFDLQAILKRSPVVYEESMNASLFQDCARFNALLHALKASLDSLQAGLRGELIMSPELEEVQQALYERKVPQSWLARSYPSMKPFQSYVNDLCDRCEFMMTWALKGTPSLFWLSGLYVPKGLLTAAMQSVARRRALAIETMAFDFYIPMEEGARTPEDGMKNSPTFLWKKEREHRRMV